MVLIASVPGHWLSFIFFTKIHYLYLSPYSQKTDLTKTTGDLD